MRPPVAGAKSAPTWQAVMGARGAGLVEQVVAPGDLRNRAQEVARQSARIPPPVYRPPKQALRA
jgi:hypothetical protein